MAKSICVTCLFEKETGKKVDTSRSKVAWAKKVGVSEASIRRHLQHSPTVEADPELEDDEFLSNFDIPEETVTSRGMSVRDPLTGSWQKVTWQPNKKALIDSLKYDDLVESLAGWTPTFTTEAPSGNFTSVLNASDIQVGKAHQRLGGTPETIARVRTSIERFAADVIANRPECIVLADGGDGIENCWNVPSQLVTNDLAVPEQIRVFRRLMLEAIKTLAPLVDRLIYVAVPSNHGQARVGYKSPGGTVDADFGLEISYQLEDAVSMSPHLSHVEFVRPAPLDEIAVVDVSNTRLMFHHGHQSSGPSGHARWWADMAHARHPGWDADIFFAAHYHSLRVEQSGNARWIIGVSSSDSSSDWFTNRRGDFAKQGMTAVNVRDGQWSDLRIL